MPPKAAGATDSGSPAIPLVSSPDRNNAVRHLTVISRDLELRMTTGLVDERGFDSLRASLGPLFFLIWTEPRAITALADQLGVSKQACSQLANLAEKAGYVQRIPAPDDGRSKLLQLSSVGRTLVQHSIEIIRCADQEYAGFVGRKRYSRFTKTIAAIYKALDFPADSGLSFLESATRTVGTLPLVTQRAQQALMRATAAHGHAGLKMSHGDVLPFMGAGGIRTSDLTRIHGGRRQAVGATVRDLVSLGYLRTEADPRDRRATLLFLSDRGHHMVQDSLAELGRLQNRIERVLGKTTLAEFFDTADRLQAALGADEDVFELAQGSSSPALKSNGKSGGRVREMEQLAARLHRELGDRAAIRLAELLQSRVASEQ